MSEQSENARLEAKKARKKQRERKAGNIALRLFVGPLRAMPLPVGRLLGRALGVILYRTIGRYRRAALKNLNLIYGADTTEAERTRMAKEVYRHFGQAAVEFLKLPRLSRQDLDRMVTVEGEENLRSALAAGKGTLLITGHFGNWEMLARWLATHGYVLNVIARDTRDPDATRVMEDTREGSGAHVLYRGSSARALLQCLKRNEIVAILPDQNAADVFVPFLGQPTGTVDGPAVIHLKTGAPLLFSWCVRLPDNNFSITFEPPVTIAPTGRREEDNAHVMTVINAHLGEQIRMRPTQWLWLHDRWKASPGVFPGGDEEARQMRLRSAEWARESRERLENARAASESKQTRGES